MSVRAGRTLNIIQQIHEHAGYEFNIGSPASAPADEEIAVNPSTIGIKKGKTTRPEPTGKAAGAPPDYRLITVALTQQIKEHPRRYAQQIGLRTLPGYTSPSTRTSPPPTVEHDQNPQEYSNSTDEGYPD